MIDSVPAKPLRTITAEDHHARDRSSRKCHRLRAYSESTVVAGSHIRSGSVMNDSVPVTRATVASCPVRVPGMEVT